MNTFTDYYAVLGIDTSATSRDVKDAFKKLARQYHPDIYKGADANERMMQILQAYRTLNNVEARREYDVIYRTHVAAGKKAAASFEEFPAGNYTQRPGSSTASAKRGATSAVTSRPDPARHYAFTSLLENKATVIDLVDYEYRLSAVESTTLLREGFVRGDAEATQRQQYYCQRCHHRWPATAQFSTEPVMRPLVCPHCYAHNWTEFLLLRCSHCHTIFASEQLRYEVLPYSSDSVSLERQGRLYYPYELFPLCPYCRRSHWCPAEERRVAILRQKVRDRATANRTLWFLCFAVVILLCISFLLLRYI